VKIREGGPDDAAAVAKLHTESWRSAYAGIMPAGYLDGPLEATQLEVWEARFAALAYLGGGPPPCLLVAEDAHGIGGFVYLIPQADDRILLDNLHVRPHRKRSGVGGRLLRQGLGWAATHHPGRPVHLEVLRDNTPARAFYERLGGSLTREFVERFHAGFELDVLEYTWPPEAVLEHAGRSEAVPGRAGRSEAVPGRAGVADAGVLPSA